MRRHRNPRYAPEYLEKKLSPTGLVAPLTAIVIPFLASFDDPEPLPEPGPGDPPLPPQLPIPLPILPRRTV